MSIGACLALLLAGSTGWADTLPDGWAWRRPLAFKQAASDAPGDNVAWTEFYANGAQARDAADLRITTADRVVVPHRLLQASADNDLVRVAFATRSDGPYYAWWGNPAAGRPDKELDIRRGVLVEELSVAGLPAGGRAREVAALEAAAGRPVRAATFAPELSLGYNPFGDEPNVLLRFTAAFKIDRAVKQNVAFTVSDSGLLLIDGKEVARDLRAGLQGRVRNPVPVDLALGWHTAEVRQVNVNGGNMAMAVAWQAPPPPGARGDAPYTTLPSAIIAPAARATAGPLEKVGAAFTPDVLLVAEAEGFVPPGGYVQRYSFEVQYPTTLKPTITWDFGDGQTIAGAKKVTHIFLVPGNYAVSVTLGLAGGGEAAALATTVRVGVRDRMYVRFPRPPEDPAKAVQAVLKGYDPKALSAAAALRGTQFFEAAGDADAQAAWGQAWLAAKEDPAARAPDAVVAEQAHALGRLLTGRRKDAEAAAGLLLAAQKPVAPETAADLLRQYVVTACDYADDAKGALDHARAWEKKAAGSKPAAALVQVAVAYAAIAAGDGPAARQAIDAAAALRATGGPGFAGGGGGGGGAGAGAGTFAQAQLRQGVLARNVENYLRTHEYDEAWRLVDTWEGDYPDALWEGFTRTLRVKLAAAEGRNLVAARIALAHARANPDGFYAAELLYRASENFKRGGEQQQAAAVMDLLTGKYPESPYARGEKAD
jgi:hypothetical protein